MTSGGDVVARANRSPWIHAAIAVEGAIALIVSVLVVPVGLVLVLAHAVLAVATHGALRKMFGVIAVACAILCAVVLFLLLPAGARFELGPVVRLD